MMQSASFFPVEGFNPQQMVTNARNRVESTVDENMVIFISSLDNSNQAYQKYKVYNIMSKTVTKISEKVQNKKETSN